MSSSPSHPLRQALEAALTADPDDLGSHAAYADLLLEQGDPRGEFIQVQLALEDESRSPDERQALQRREQELFTGHQRGWLGELWPFLHEDATVPDWLRYVFGDGHCLAEFSFRRGWLDKLHVYYLSLPFARALKRAAECRLLRDLIIDTIADSEDGRIPEDGIPGPPGPTVPGDPDYERHVGLHPLRGCPFLTNVSQFRIGLDQGDEYRNYNCHVMSHVTLDIVRLMPRLEELYLWANNFDLNELFRLPALTHLRVLHVYHGMQVHRLQLLADNPAFRCLTHLLIHPHNALAWFWNAERDQPAGYVQEQGYLPLSVVRPLLRSKVLRNLTHLRLRCSSIGDEGCLEIVDSGILKRLKMLDLRHGCITDEGARILADCTDLLNLHHLDIRRNALTRWGVQALRETGVSLWADDQQTQEEVDDGEYLREGEFE